MAASLMTKCAGCEKELHVTTLRNDAEERAEDIGWSRTPDGLWWCVGCGAGWLSPRRPGGPHPHGADR